MKIILPGGSGQVGTILARHLHTHGHEVLVLSRTPKAQQKPTPWRTAHWDALTLSPSWTTELEVADAVINLAGRTVNCRYTPENRRQIYDSRIIPTRLLGCVPSLRQRTPAAHLDERQHSPPFIVTPLDRPQDESRTGELARRTNGPPTPEQPNLPETWAFSADVGYQWEEAFFSAPTPATRKIALRTSMVMSPDPGGVFSVLSGLVRAGLGGAQGPGTQFISWMHDHDYAAAIDLLLAPPRDRR